MPDLPQNTSAPLPSEDTLTQAPTPLQEADYLPPPAPSPATGGTAGTKPVYDFGRTRTLPEGVSPEDKVPVRFQGQLRKVLAKDYQDAVDAGAEPVSPEEYAKIQAKRAAYDARKVDEQKFGHVSDQLWAAGSAALESIPLVGAGIISQADPATRQHIRDVQRVNPWSTHAGTGAGIVGQIAAAVLSGGGTATAEVGGAGTAAATEAAASAAAAGEGVVGAAEAAEAGAAAARAVEAPGMLRTLGETVAAPQHLVTKVATKVEQGVSKIIEHAAGGAVESAAGKLLQKTTAKVVGEAVAGGALGASDYLNEVALDDDHHLSGERFMQYAGTGALFGGVLGGGLSLGGAALSKIPVKKALSEVPGRLAMDMGLEGRMGLRLPEQLEKVGGKAAVGQRLIDEGLIQSGKNVQETVPKIEAAVENAGQQIDAIRDSIGEQVPTQDVLDALREGIKKESSKPLPEKAAIDAIQSVHDEIAAKFTPGYDQITNHIDADMAEKYGVDYEKLRAETAEKYEKEFGPVDEAAVAERVRKRHAGERERPIGEGLPDFSDDAFDKTEVATAEKPLVEERAAGEKTGVSLGEENQKLRAQNRAQAFEQEVAEKINKAKLERARLITIAQDKAITEALESRARLIENAKKNGIPGTNIKSGLTFSELAEYRKRVDQKVNWAAGEYNRETPQQLAWKDIRSKLETLIEEGMDKIDKKIPDEGLLRRYREQKLRYRQLSIAEEAFHKAAWSQQKNSGIGLGGYITSGAVLGHVAGPMAIPAAVATGIAHRIVKTRGLSTAAVLADKIAVMTGLRTAAEKSEKLLKVAVGRVVGEKSPPAKVSDHGFPGFKEKEEAVLASEKDPQGHLEHIQRIGQAVGAHAPETGQAFVSAALRATAFLSSVLPRSRPVNPMQPNGPKIEPTQHDKFIFGRQWDAVNHPVTAIDHVADGTIIPEEVAAMKASHPKTLMKITKELTKELAKETGAPKKGLSISILMNAAATPTLEQANSAMLQGNFAQGVKDGKENTPSQAGKTPSAGGPKRATPKAEHMSFASSVSLPGLGSSRQ